MNTPNADALIKVLEQRNQEIQKKEESERKQIKLTPKGSRWGDIIRRELSDPNSAISRAAKNLKTWKYIIKERQPGQPGWSFESSLFGGVDVVCRDHHGLEIERESMSPHTWVKDCI